MSHEKSRQWGVTPPVSFAEPTPHDLRLTDDLIKTLQDYNLFESEKEAQKRTMVLSRLSELVKAFVFHVSKAKGYSDEMAKEAGGKIFTFGSYRLGVHSPAADIDTLCVVPQHVGREHFFTVAFDMLKREPQVTELTAVADAYVPVIKMNFAGIPIDLVFASLAIPKVPDDLELSDNSLLMNLDERCVRSLNGSRVTDEILRLVPNVDVFRIALKTVKFWAKRRAIYSNVMGFMGGVAWAMLVARICQLYPNACAAYIVQRFFYIMYQWNWPLPVILKKMEEGPPEIRVWNPSKYPADKSHRMPVITPAYPSMCATHNVTDSTRAIMIKEFKRGADIVDKIMCGLGKWDTLFDESDFFHAYKHYLQVVASSDSPEAQLQWSGLVKSRIRQLVLNLELVDMLVLAHPYIKGIDKVHYCRNDTERWEAKQGVYPKERTFIIDEDHWDANHEDQLELLKQHTHHQEPLTPVYTSTFYIGLYVEPKSDASVGPRKLNLVWPAQDFLKLVKSWDKYDPSSMHITVKNLKGSADFSP